MRMLEDQILRICQRLPVKALLELFWKAKELETERPAEPAAEPTSDSSCRLCRRPIFNESQSWPGLCPDCRPDNKARGMRRSPKEDMSPGQENAVRALEG